MVMPPLPTKRHLPRYLKKISPHTATWTAATALQQHGQYHLRPLSLVRSLLLLQTRRAMPALVLQLLGRVRREQQVSGQLRQPLLGALHHRRRARAMFLERLQCHVAAMRRQWRSKMLLKYLLCLHARRDALRAVLAAPAVRCSPARLSCNITRPRAHCGTMSGTATLARMPRPALAMYTTTSTALRWHSICNQDNLYALSARQTCPRSAHSRNRRRMVCAFPAARVTLTCSFFI